MKNLPKGFEIDEDGKYYIQITGDRPLLISDADLLYEDGYQLISMDASYTGLIFGSQVFTVSFFKWRDAQKCGS